jgi:hypothetical protein
MYLGRIVELGHKRQIFAAPRHTSTQDARTFSRAAAARNPHCGQRWMGLWLPVTCTISRCLIAQYVPDCHDQVAAELVCGFAALILDPVVTGAIAKWPVFEFSIAVANHFSADLFAQKIIEGPGLGCVAGKDDDRTIVYY